MSTVHNRLAKNLIQLQRDLARQDGRWEGVGRGFVPAREGDVRKLGELSRRMDECAADFQRCVPDRPKVSNALNIGARDIARRAGHVEHMTKIGHGYGEGWSEALDGQIDVVGYAIDVILGVK